MPDGSHASIARTSVADLEREAVSEIRIILARDLGIDREITGREELMGDLALDSMALTTLAVGLEDHFRVILTDEDAALTVSDLARLVAMRASASPL